MYGVFSGIARSQTPTQPWLDSGSYGCIVWQASLQAVLNKPAVGLQCFQMCHAWLAGTAHLSEPTSGEHPASHPCNTPHVGATVLSDSADVVQLRNSPCVLSMMSACVQYLCICACCSIRRERRVGSVEACVCTCAFHWMTHVGC